MAETGEINEKNRKMCIRTVLSVCGLLAKSSFYKVVGAMLVMAAVQGALLLACLNRQKRWYPEELAEAAYIPAVFLAALGLLFFILALTENAMEEKSAYTMLRLRLSCQEIFLIKTAYNLLCLGMLFVLQVWIAVWAADRSMRGTDVGGAAAQQLFLAFYRNDFLHCLLPMEEAGKWVRNLLLLFALAAEAAAGMGKKNYVAPVLLAVLTARWFVSPMGVNLMDVACGAVCGIVIVRNLYGAWNKREGRTV